MSLPPAKRVFFQQNLKKWYDAHGRHDLPWRQTRDPYAIYLSEVMLQQTQVATVLDRFYHPFLKRFPTLRALADAPLPDVMTLWQGLGYYRRAANLHKAAQMSGGKMPDTVEGLMALPGIGRNTAHAVAAFAYRLPVPVMEANVKRVLHRIFALPEASDKTLWEKAALLLDTENPFEYNQAMMDIGAMVCTPRAPRCGECPASSICEGRASPLSYPAPKAKKEVPTRRRVIVLFMEAGGKIHSTARTGSFLHGLHQFAELEEGATEIDADGEKISLQDATLLGGVSHAYSHFKLEGEVRLVRLKQRYSGKDWHKPEALRKLPLSRTEEKSLTLLDAYLASCSRESA